MKDHISSIVKNALDEDIGPGDITTDSTVIKDVNVVSSVIAKEDCIVCGNDVMKEVYHQLDENIKIDVLIKDGNSGGKGDVIAKVTGKAKPILTGERTVLNFMQRLSGIATKTNNMVNMIKGSSAKILDTRKTTPGLRIIEKYAVKCGGGQNHRMGLYDQILIKDNHIALDGIENAIKNAKETGKKVEVEVIDFDQLQKALDSDADIIMLDNMSTEDMKKAIELIGSNAIIEVSGGVKEERLKELSSLGVDWISVGSLTHSVKSIDISMEMKKS